MAWIHLFERGTSPLTLLLLHGTGGDEGSLLSLGRSLSPGASLLSPRGPVSEAGMPRFFRRLAEGVFDEEDVQQRAGELRGFIRESAAQYQFDAANVVAVGYANGANIAAAALLLHGPLLRGALLLRPMVPLVPDAAPDLGGVALWLGAGTRDPLVTPANAEQLAAMLRASGAEVTLRWQEGGHQLAREEIAAAREWLLALPPA